MTYYTRKSPRIPDFDYSSTNYYFLTLCTHNRRCIFGDTNHLNQLGQLVEKHIRQIPEHYEKVFVDKYVVMPNHIHIILVLMEENNKEVPQIVAQFKAGVSREAKNWFPDIRIWQRSFHDHVIRDQQSYEKIWIYIEGNPQCWKKDCFYIDSNYETNQ